MVAVAFPQLPTLKAARKAIRQGRVLVDGELNAKHDALAPPIGHCLRVQQQRVSAAFLAIVRSGDGCWGNFFIDDNTCKPWPINEEIKSYSSGQWPMDHFL